LANTSDIDIDRRLMIELVTAYNIGPVRYEPKFRTEVKLGKEAGD
jgi:hypothetical protein